MIEEKPVWRFDKVEITYLQSMYEGGIKSRNTCMASIDFGFFIVMDIGITLEREYDNRITWSDAFGWSQFRFALSQIDNPYVEEVMKLARMIKEELDRKRGVIIDFLNDPSTAAKITKE